MADAAASRRTGIRRASPAVKCTVGLSADITLRAVRPFNSTTASSLSSPNTDRPSTSKMLGRSNALAPKSVPLDVIATPGRRYRSSLRTDLLALPYTHSFRILMSRPFRPQFTHQSWGCFHFAPAAPLTYGTQSTASEHSLDLVGS